MGIPSHKVDFEADYPPPDTSYVRIITPMVGVPFRMRIVGNRSVAVLTHWLSDDRMKGGGRTVPHQVPDDTCPICIERDQKHRWHAYLAGWSKETNRYYLADITAQAVHKCPNLHPRSGYDLRGYGLVLRRTGVSRNSPVSAEIEGPRLMTLANLPDIDVVTILRRLWGILPGETWRTSDPDSDAPL